MLKWEEILRAALEAVAFTQGCPIVGVIALLETALEALDKAGLKHTAIHVDMALSVLASEVQKAAGSDLDAYLHRLDKNERN